ncbi:hypothetical protein J6590_097198, partial [Homalodisca vitripennis]
RRLVFQGKVGAGVYERRKVEINTSKAPAIVGENGGGILPQRTIAMRCVVCVSAARVEAHNS